MPLKLDMSKAYDIIEWKFVEQTLTSMGYLVHMIQLIMRCISTISYQILINGQPSHSFSPERGLRQGIPSHPIFSSFVMMFSHALSTKKSELVLYTD